MFLKTFFNQSICSLAIACDMALSALAANGLYRLIASGRLQTGADQPDALE
jgi:hypothetical protein